MLIIGGSTSNGATPSVLSFDPSIGHVTGFRHGALAMARYGHVVGKLSDATIIVAGGRTPEEDQADSTEIFSNSRGQFRAAPRLTEKRWHAAGAVLGEWTTSEQ